MHSSFYIDKMTGRPRVAVDIEDVELLRQLHFTWTNIAEILGVSRATLYQRMDEEGVLRDRFFSDIHDSELDRMLHDIKVNYPNDGEVMLMGHLTCRRIYVPRARLRASIHRVDHSNTVASNRAPESILCRWSKCYLAR